MATVVTVDKAGRIVIPKDTRDAQKLRSGTQLLLVEARDGLWLQRLDPEEWARRVREEMAGVDLGPLVRKVERETERFARKRYPALARR